MVSEDTPNRRQLLAMIGTASAASLAGCSGGEGEDSQDNNGEMGERVPTATLHYWPNQGALSEQYENTIPILEEALNELGVDFDAQGVEQSTQIDDYVAGRHTSHFTLFPYSTTPSRLDPQYVIQKHTAAAAGSYPGGNQLYYANCEYTDYIFESTTKTDPDERHRLITNAMEVLSEDVAAISLTDQPTFGIFRSDEVNAEALGDGGFTVLNPHPYIYSSPANGDQIVSSFVPSLFETTNYMIVVGAFSSVIWNHLMGTTLTEYDENYELQNMLAKSIEMEDDGQRITVEIKDATFHNGDPITAEDVKFSSQLRWDNPGAYVQSEAVPYDTIEIIDDKTVEFNLEGPYAPLLSRSWANEGILHKASWEEAGAIDDPEGAQPDPFIGSGPYAIENFRRGQLIHLTPHDGHPEHQAEGDLVFQSFNDAQAAYRALENNEIHVIPDVSANILERSANDLGDRVTQSRGLGTMAYGFHPANSWGPTKHRPFRLAVAKAIDRSRIVEQAYRGNADPELHCRLLLDAHPFGTPTDVCLQYTDDETGDVEDARSVLEEAGFSWDDNGNLHYPPDANLEPIWPSESKPIESDTKEFPCLDEDGYVPPEER